MSIAISYERRATLLLRICLHGVAHLRRDVLRAGGQWHGLGGDARAAPPPRRGPVLRAGHQEQSAHAEERQHMAVAASASFAARSLKLRGENHGTIQNSVSLPKTILT